MKLRRRLLQRLCVAAALITVGIGLSACVSDSPAPLALTGATPTPSPAAVPTVAPAATLPAIPTNRTVAIVAGTPIAGSTFADAVAQQRKAAQTQAQQQGAAPPDERQIRATVLNGLIDRVVIHIYAAQHHITVSQQEVNNGYNQTKIQVEQQGLQQGQPVTFTDVLAQYGFTVQSFKQAVYEGLLRNKVAQQVAPIPPVEVVQARHILIGTTGPGALSQAKAKARADQIYAQLQKDPSKFAALARKYSTDQGSAAQGGELGLFPRGAMVPAFEKVAFSLKVGQISKPVRTQYGYHIIQVEAHKTVPYTQLNQQFQQPYVQRQQLKFQQWLTAQRKADHVRILISGLPGVQ